MTTDCKKTSLTTDHINAINEAHQSCCRSARGALLAAMECGSLLAEAKQTLPHGTWQTWLHEHCPEIGQSTARMFEGVAE